MTPYQLGRRVFTPERVWVLRALHDAGLASMAYLARKCDVSTETIKGVVRRRSYRDVEERPEVLVPWRGRVVLGVHIPQDYVPKVREAQNGVSAQ